MTSMVRKLSKKLHSILVGTDEPEDVPDVAIYTAKRNEVMAGDIEGVRQFINNILSDSEMARSLFQSFRFMIQDYDEDHRELFEIPECRRWFQGIDAAIPYLIYFIPCDQYTLYVGSQKGMSGSRLSFDDLRVFLRHRDGALRKLARDLNEPYGEVAGRLRQAFQSYSGLELEPW